MSPEDELPPETVSSQVEDLRTAGPVHVNGSAPHNWAAKKKTTPEDEKTVPLPNDLEAEQQLLGCCIVDGEDPNPTIKWCLDHGITQTTFFTEQYSSLFFYLEQMFRAGEPIAVDTVGKYLKRIGTGIAGNEEDIKSLVLGCGGTSLRAKTSALVLLDMQGRRNLIDAANKAIQAAYRTKTSLAGTVQRLKTQTSDLVPPTDEVEGFSFFDLTFPRPGDRSILLGNRYLNRGDGGVLVSTSGMGKSSMSIQMAITWALGRDFHGIKSNGPLKSLIVQAEDSDGDIAEVWASVCHGLKLTEEEKVQAAQRIRLVTDRVNRGDAFIHRLRHIIEKLKPDLVWINPLQSFMGGDLTESKDLGAFLRAGLNAINEPPAFGYIVVHHTTKPPQEKKDRQWNEVMYDMAGGAEIINWARFVMSLRATPDAEGLFELVLAKRGRRAGVTKRIEAGLQTRDEVQLKINLKHASGTCVANGITIPLVFWEAAEAKPKAPPSGAGRPATLFTAFAKMFPTDETKAEGLSALHRRSTEFGSISKSALLELIRRSVDDGFLQEKTVNQSPKYWRKLV